MSTISTDFDVIIIGGGPGGLSAAAWCAELSLKAAIFEKKTELGGQLLNTFNPIKNYLGVDAANGRELRDIFLQQLANIDVRRETGAEIVAAHLASKTVTLANGSHHSAKAIIIATGVRRKELGVPGANEFLGRGILESGVKNKDEVKGKIVVIVGGGDAALENALSLSDVAKKIFVVHRNGEFKARKEFVERANTIANIKFLFDAQVSAITGDNEVVSVELQNLKSGTRSKLAVAAVLVRIGVMPNTELFARQTALDESGYIKIDSRCLTNLDGIYAVGDVANPVSPTSSSAVGMGATAAKAISQNLKDRPFRVTKIV
ncbi:MAG: FAD-dependent oxidoreductase [Pyrinomonadaceae bacterium]